MAGEAGGALAATEGAEAALVYLSDAAHACGMAGSASHAWALAKLGLGYAGDQRNVAWARLVSYDQERRSAERIDHPGVPLDTPERRESAGILRSARLDPVGLAPMEAVFDCREEVYSSGNLIVLTCYGGEYGHCLPLFWAEAEAARSRGQVARAARCLALASSCAGTLGRLDEARSAVAESEALAARVGQPMGMVLINRELLCAALDDGWAELAPAFESLGAVHESGGQLGSRTCAKLRGKDRRSAG